MPTHSKVRAIIRDAILGAALTAFTIHVSAQSSDSAAIFQLNIPSQNLNDALQALALASRHRLFYQADIVSGKVNSAVNGTYTTEEAVRRMLAGTGLVYEISQDG